MSVLFYPEKGLNTFLGNEDKAVLTIATCTSLSQAQHSSGNVG